MGSQNKLSKSLASSLLRGTLQKSITGMAERLSMVYIHEGMKQCSTG